MDTGTPRMSPRSTLACTPPAACSRPSSGWTPTCSDARHGQSCAARWQQLCSSHSSSARASCRAGGTGSLSAVRRVWPACTSSARPYLVRAASAQGTTVLCPRRRAHQSSCRPSSCRWLDTIPRDPRPARAQLPPAVVAAPAASAVPPVTPARRTSAGASSSTADAPTRASGDPSRARLCRALAWRRGAHRQGGPAALQAEPGGAVHDEQARAEAARELDDRRRAQHHRLGSARLNGQQWW